MPREDDECMDCLDLKRLEKEKERLEAELEVYRRLFDSVMRAMVKKAFDGDDITGRAKVMSVLDRWEGSINASITKRVGSKG